MAQRHREGVSVRNAPTRIGYAGDSAKPHAVGAYFEAPIEQSPVLEAHNKTIAAVQGALGQRWYDVTVRAIGSARSPTPMVLCLDALLAALNPIRAVNGMPLDHAPHGRATVAWLDVHPNSRNVIPGGVTLTVDLRAAADTGLTAMDRALLRHVRRRPHKAASPPMSNRWCLSPATIRGGTGRRREASR